MPIICVHTFNALRVCCMWVNIIIISVMHYIPKYPNSPQWYRSIVCRASKSNLSSSARSCSFGCTVNKLSLKSRSNRMVSRPLLQDSATYALNPDRKEDGGLARSTITDSIVCPCDLKSVKAYAGVNAYCCLCTVFPCSGNDVLDGKTGTMPSERPGNVIRSPFKGANRMAEGGVR